MELETLVSAGEVTTVVTSGMMSSVYGVQVALREIADLNRKVCTLQYKEGLTFLIYWY